MNREQIERALASLDPSPRGEEAFSGSAALRLTRIVAHADAWPPPVLALALRDAWAAYEDRDAPERVPDAVVAGAVEAAGDVAGDPIAAVGEALGCYHGALELGLPARARDEVRRRVAVALARALARLA